jgi:succinate dehydrogenase / fumarate reductase cytochrome b subunit
MNNVCQQGHIVLGPRLIWTGVSIDEAADQQPDAAVDRLYRRGATSGGRSTPMSSSTVLRPGGSSIPPPRRGSVYRGAEGMWSWVAHRITGVLTFFFLFAHVLDTALVRVSPESYNKIIETYKNPLVNLLEVGLVGAVLFHSLNGIRIMLIDFWSKGTRYQRTMLWIVVATWIVVMVPAVYFMLEFTIRKTFGDAS